MPFKSLLLLSCMLVPVAVQAAEDTRVQKTVLLDKITFNPVSEAKPDEITLRDKNDIFLSPDAAHFAVRLNSSEKSENILLDGKASPKYESISELTWDRKGNLFFIGHRDGKDFMVRNNFERASSAADEIEWLAPLDYITLEELPIIPSSWVSMPAIYAKRTGDIWYLRSPNRDVSDGTWANVSGIWAASGEKDTSIVYEVTDAAGKVALLKDGESLGGPRSIFDGVAVNPAWSPDGKHIAYCVKNGEKDYLCVDGKPVSVIDRAPQFSWSPNSSRVVVWGNELKTFSIILDAAGTPTPGNAIDATPFAADKLNNGITWSRDGMHWGFFAPASGDIYVDGVKKVSIPKGNGFPRLLALDEDASTIAYSYKMDDAISVKAGNYEVGGFKGVRSLRFDDEGKEPLFLAQKDENWSLHSGKDDIVFLTMGKDKAQPLTDWISLGKGVYRIVMLEEEFENLKIIRYDIALGR